MGRKPDYRPVGYVVSAEGKKITQSKRHSKAKGYLKKAGEGSGRRIGLAPAIKSVQQLRKFRHTIAARAIALASKALLNEHKKEKFKITVIATGIDGKQVRGKNERKVHQKRKLPNFALP